MLCHACKTQTVEKIGRYHFQECGLDNVWLINCRMRVCPNNKCGVVYPELPDADTASKSIARVILARQYKLDGDSIVFLRKLMSLTSEQFAALLGTTRIEVSRWENAKVNISAFYDFRLRLIAVERLFPVSEQLLLNQEINRVIRVAYTDAPDDDFGMIEVPTPSYLSLLPV